MLFELTNKQQLWADIVQAPGWLGAEDAKAIMPKLEQSRRLFSGDNTDMKDISRFLAFAGVLAVLHARYSHVYDVLDAPTLCRVAETSAKDPNDKAFAQSLDYIEDGLQDDILSAVEAHKVSPQEVINFLIVLSLIDLTLRKTAAQPSAAN